VPAAWRIVKARHASGAFDGEGARLYGGRWSSPGTPMVYLAESRSLALLEVLVHVGDASLLAHYVCIRVELERADCAELDPARLPADWAASPAPYELQRLGDAWVAAGSSLALRVPSAVVPEERLVLVNPRHPRAARLRVGDAEPLRVDPRLR